MKNELDDAFDFVNRRHNNQKIGDYQKPTQEIIKNTIREKSMSPTTRYGQVIASPNNNKETKNYTGAIIAVIIAAGITGFLIGSNKDAIAQELDARFNNFNQSVSDLIGTMPSPMSADGKVLDPNTYFSTYYDENGNPIANGEEEERQRGR